MYAVLYMHTQFNAHRRLKTLFSSSLVGDLLCQRGVCCSGCARRSRLLANSSSCALTAALDRCWLPLAADERCRLLAFGTPAQLDITLRKSYLLPGFFTDFLRVGRKFKLGNLPTIVHLATLKKERLKP